jgi:HD-GYP domain-containing protein (c-di-GMP phosphodiesterase class II)
MGMNKEVYLSSGVILTRRYIKKLAALGFYAVYVEDQLLNGIEVHDVITEKTRRDATVQVRKVLTEGAFSKDRTLNVTPELVTVAENIVAELLANPFSVVNLADIRAEEAYLYHHSVNVGVLAVLAGISLGLPKDPLLGIALGALLHDIGKLKLDSEILDKPGRLTDEEFEHVKLHCAYGQEALKEHRVAGMIAYAHHERYSGEGYPQGLKGRELSYQAQLVGIADVYDALTADRCYRKAVAPHKALELLAGSGNWWFDIKLVKNFLNCVAAYPSGTMVEVSSGEIGLVINTPRTCTFFPNVRILLDANRKKVSPYYLSTVENNLWINRVLDEEEAEVIRKILEPHNGG